jgi:hypothetical protein
MQPALTEALEAQTAPDRQTRADTRLTVARYYQILNRLRHETDVNGPDVMVTVPDREVSLAQSKLASDGAAGRALPSGGQEVKFGTGLAGGDWFGWLRSLIDWVDRRDAHSLMRPTTIDAAPLPESARIALASDWGTGLYGAPKISDTIRRLSHDRKFDLLMHLGDIYYSGTKDEVQERFLDVWPSDAATISRALNANHEMYSGGFGYFQLALPALGQQSSYFAFRNTHWLVVGLDTAYVDHDIDTEQVAWLNLVINDALADEDNPRKVLLFSHQQPFSRLNSQGPKLQQALGHLLSSRAITAWYWGHEHACVLYDQHPQWGLFGRCLGNGGIPSVREAEVKNAPDDAAQPGAARCTWKRLAATPDSPGCLVLDGPNMDLANASDQQKFGPHGFMTLELDGDQLVERVLLSDGTQLLEHVIQ